MTTEYSLGKKYINESDTRFNLEEIKKFQDDYIDLWKMAYTASITYNNSFNEEKAKKACEKFFENVGRPNRWYYTKAEYNIIISDIED